MANAAVSSYEHDDGAISLGVKSDGKFLPLLTVPAGRVAVLKAEAIDADDDDDKAEPKGGK